MARLIKHFDDILQFAAYAKNARSYVPAAHRHSRETGGYRAKFCGGTENYEQAHQLALAGWPEGCKRVQEIAGELFELVSNKVVRPEITRGVEGEELDIDAFNEGKPECFLVYQDGEAESDGSGVVRIVANLTASWNVSPQVLEVRGAALCALVQTLEFAGRRCEVITGTNQGTMQVTVTLKRASDPVQMDTLAFALAHAGFYRRLMFSAWETLPKHLLKAAGIYPNRGYGQVEALEGVQADIALPGASGDDPAWQSADTARAWVMAVLRAQGVQLAE